MTAQRPLLLRRPAGSGSSADRALNRLLIQVADAANKLMEIGFPVEILPDWPSLAEWDRELREGFLAPKRATAPAAPPAVEEVAPPSGAGAVASAGLAAAGTGGHPDNSTSELLYMAADVIGPQIKSMPEVALVFELRDRAADFAAFGD